MAISKWFKRGGTLAAVAAFALTLASCGVVGDLLGTNSSTTPDIEIKGTWVDSSYGYTGLVVSNSSVVWHYSATSSTFDDTTKYQACEVVSYSNDAWNAGDTGTGNCGYVVLKYTEPSSYVAAAAQNKYGILRWHSLATSSGVTTMYYSEGTTYYDTAALAQSSCTSSSGAFPYGYSVITKQ